MPKIKTRRWKLSFVRMIYFCALYI
uniref:Uncharacterized protein n=1 Tax=Rhizophora mucronata TaxID=61149 RepID=A0A2P2NFH3_RHIMU